MSTTKQMRSSTAWIQLAWMCDAQYYRWANNEKSRQPKISWRFVDLNASQAMVDLSKTCAFVGHDRQTDHRTRSQV